MVKIKMTLSALLNVSPDRQFATAYALGRSFTPFRIFRQKNSCRFFEYPEQEAMKDRSGAPPLTEYFSGAVRQKKRNTQKFRLQISEA